jgi:oxygen-dependent protoporphyrinogen oxidase
MKAVVVGAGLAGLAAAYRLQKAGWEVVVLEAAAEIGGRTRTFRKDGYLLERGATQLSTGYRAYLKLADEIGLGGQIAECANTVMLMRGGQLYEIDGTRPIAALFSKALSFRSKLRMIRGIRDYLRYRPKDVLDVSEAWRADTETAEAYCERRLNREIFDVLVDPLIRTYTINRGANVSALEWFSGLANLAGQRMLALRGGIGSFPAALAAMLDVRLSTPVSQVRRDRGGVLVTLEDGETISADGCVIATPLPQAAAMAPELAEAVGPLDACLKYNRAVNVYLGYRRRTLTDALGVMVPTAEHPHIGLVWFDHNKLSETVPDGHSLITCYFEEGGLNDLQGCDDAVFGKMADDFVTRLFPELAGQLDMVEVVRWRAAIPNPAPGIYTQINRMKYLLSPSDAIQLAGDYFTCTGQNSAIHWGEVAAANLIGNIPA